MPGRNGPAPGSTSFDSTKTALTLTNTTEPGAKADVSVNSSTRTTVKAGEKGTLSMQLMRTNGSNGITPSSMTSKANRAPWPVLNAFLDTKPLKIL